MWKTPALKSQADIPLALQTPQVNFQTNKKTQNGKGVEGSNGNALPLPPTHKKNIKSNKKGKGVEGSTGFALPPPPTKKKSSIITINIRGLIPGTRRDKLTFISALANESEAEIIFITETHLSSKISDSEIEIPGWGSTRGDRIIRQSGGAMILYRDQMTVFHEHAFSNSYVETSMLYTPSNDSAWIVIYRPPHCPAPKFIEAMNSIQDWITKVSTIVGKTPNIYFSGDLNMPDMKNWDPTLMEDVISTATSRAATENVIGNDKEQISMLIKFAHLWSLTQEVQDNTHGDNILDLLFTNNSDSIEEVEVLENISVTDHAFIIARLNRESPKEVEEVRVNFCSTQIPKYNIKGGSPEAWEASRKQLADTVFEDDLHPEELCDKLISTLENIVVTNFEKFAPPKPGGKTKNFIHREARCLMRRKLNACRALKKSTDPAAQEKLRKKIKSIEDDLRVQTHKKRLHDENKAKHDLSKAPSDFYNLVRKLTKKSDRIGPLMRTSVNKLWPTCEVLSAQYSSVFSSPREADIIHDPVNFFNKKTQNGKGVEGSTGDALPLPPPNKKNTKNKNTQKNGEGVEGSTGDALPPPPPHETTPSLSVFEMNTQLLNAAIDKLPAKSAPGPDGIPNLLIKQLKFEVIPILNTLFQKSLDSGAIPSSFLKAFVKPIKKPKKPRSQASSYRPVSLTSGLSKVFEHVIKPQIQSFLETNNLLRDSQHGFRPMRSCLSQLLCHYNSVISDLEQGKIIDVIYLDFAKAFDSVDIHILANELRKLGISGKAGVWLFRFLSDRLQQIIAGNQISSPSKVLSGVPQGTILGPVLFLIMINSLSDTDLESRISMFADDTRLAKGISSEDDILRLQTDLNNVFKWQKDMNMEFNGDKFQHLSHGKNFRNNRLIPKGLYTDNEGNLIKSEINVRDLGIEISASTDFSTHIDLTCKRARDKIGWIYRSFYCREVKFLSFMWRNYVQPILDYGCQLWAPDKQSEIKKLEDIFKKISARAQQYNISAEKVHFWERLILFDIKSQQRRHERFRIICIWKIIHNLTPNCGIEWNAPDENGTLCKIPSSPYSSSRRTKSLREASFQVRGPLLFNSMPLKIRTMSGCSLNSFKNALDSFLKIIPDTPISQTYFPTPSDRLSGTPSNSLLDWIRYLEIPNRRKEDLDLILSNLMRTKRFQDTKIILDPLASTWTNAYNKGPTPNAPLEHSVN